MQWTSDYELRKMTVSWSRTHGTAPAQDSAKATFHFLNLTGGDPDATWTTGDYTTVEAAFDVFWDAIRSFFPVSEKLKELSWRADGPAFRPHGTNFSPTLRVVARAQPGSASGQGLPPQTAVSVTEVTPAKFTVLDVEGSGTQLRNRWGRFYLPAPAIIALSEGRIETSICGNIATATQAFYNTCVTADIVPVMYSPTTGSSWAVSEVHVDDIFDVIRSRRYITPLVRFPKLIDTP